MAGSQPLTTSDLDELAGGRGLNGKKHIRSHRIVISQVSDFVLALVLLLFFVHQLTWWTMLSPITSPSLGGTALPINLPTAFLLICCPGGTNS